MKDRPLTSKQQRFCEEYQIDLNATQATIRAGYKCKNDHVAQVIGWDNLLKPVIKSEIIRLKAVVSEKIGLTAQYVLDKLKKIAEDTELTHPAVSVKAYELLGKHKGIFELDNEQSRPDARTFNLTQLTAIIEADKAKVKEIDGITGGIAGESLTGQTGG